MSGAAPDLPHGCGSWIVTRRDTGDAVLETFSRKVAESVNLGPYRVESALAYLQRVNAMVRA